MPGFRTPLPGLRVSHYRGASGCTVAGRRSRRLAVGGQAKVAQYAAIAAVTPVNAAARAPT